MSFIEIRDIHKTFYGKKRSGEETRVLKGIDLNIEKGDIFGIVGFSGAGKSTLARCINRLEEPDSGQIIIDGVDITGLSKKELALRRRKIGMIFQQFNLFESKSVFKNIAYPLMLDGWSKDRINSRVEEILSLIGLEDKRDAYPGQLSGGQKQRVGIGRALANQPDVLLSDEATSALDPQTTLSVLDLLREINKKFGITILLITHELEAIKYICSNMAVLENGVVTESGSVRGIFQNPNSKTGRIFIDVYSSFRKDDLYGEGDGI